MDNTAKDTIFKALADEDYHGFSKAVKVEIDRKVKEHPLTNKMQDDFDKYKHIENLYAQVKDSMNPKKED